MRKNLQKKLSVLIITVIFTSQNALAAGTGMPWEGPLDQILQSISGPVARVMAIIAITVTGLAATFGEGGAGMRKMLWVVFGLSIAFAATSFFLSFFGFAGGVAF